MNSHDSQMAFERRLNAAGLADLSDIERIERTPLSDHGLPPNTFAFLRRGLEETGSDPALSLLFDTHDIGHLHTLSGEALLTQITQTANAFRRVGLQRGDVVALILPNLPETHLAIWGGEAAGIVFPMNPALGAEQIAGMLRAAQVRLLVALGPTPITDIWQKALSAASEAPTVKAVLAVSVSRYLPDPVRSMIETQHRLAVEGHAGQAQILDFHNEVEQSHGGALDFPEPESSDIASYFNTGGTTGAPKIARRTHMSEVFNAWVMALVNRTVISRGSTVFAGLPLFHVNAQLVSGLASFASGAHVILGTPQGYRGEGVIPRLWEIIEHHRIKSFSCVPTVISALLKHPIGDRDVSSLDVVICGAAPMPKDLFRAFEQTTGRMIIEGYGLTEGACASSVNPRGGERKIGSIGLRLPYQDMRVMILDTEGTYIRDAEADETGVLAIKGPNVFAGYLDPEHNRSAWIERGGETWLNTGDLARQDSDGYFWLTGRKKELIIRGGHNIDPKNIEEALTSHPAVALAAAVGRPDAHAGEVPVAYVQLHAGATVTEPELNAFAADKLPERATRPKSIRITHALPTTDVGKIFKPALLLAEIEAVIREECAAVGATPARVSCVFTKAGRATAEIDLPDQADKLAERLRQFAFGWEIRSPGMTISG